MLTPAVTVVLLPRPRGGPLARSIDDAAAQRGVDVEIVGPAGDPRVRGLDVAPRAHPAELLGAALASAGGAWIAFLEAGDRWHPDHLSATVQAATRSPARWAYGGALLLDAAGEVIGRRAAASPEGLRQRLAQANVIGGASSVVCRRELLDERTFDRRLSALVLWAAWIGLAAEPAVACPEPLVAERWEEDRAVLDAEATLRDLHLMRSERTIEPSAHAPLTELAARFAQLGHRRDAARLYARASLGRRSPADAARAVRALRDRGRVSAPIDAPDWLRPGASAAA
jgi:hypothetical protein